MNEISTKVVKLDFNYILDNCFKPQLWDKTWTIFAYDSYKITFELDTINTKNKSVRYLMRLYSNSQTPQSTINI